jgi:uncharacterized protein (DUF433 family)
MSIQDIESKLEHFSRAEKVELVQKPIQNITDTWPGIEKIPGVAGGDTCIVRTRIPVWALENYRRLDGVRELSSKIIPHYGLPTWSMPGLMWIRIKKKSSVPSMKMRGINSRPR